MKSPITKLTATTAIIITIVFLIAFFDNASTPIYALEQTIEANHTIKTIYLRILEGEQSIENNGFMYCWIKYDDDGSVSNFRCNSYEEGSAEGDNLIYAVWNEGVLKTWRPSENVVIIIRVNDMDKYWEHFAKEYDPKLILKWLYVSRGNAATELQIDEPAKDSNSVYVKAINSIDKTRLNLVVDRQTKLVKELSRYRFREQNDELDMRIEVLAYNQSIDPSMFELRGIPDDALVIDRIDQLVGLEQGNLTNNEIAAKVVREGLEATIAKDYEKVSRLMEGVPGDRIQGFIEEQFNARLVRITSIGRPEPHERSGFHIYVPCEIEVENEERVRWTVSIIATTEFIHYQAGRRWVMHSPVKNNGSHIPSISTTNAQDRIDENIIVPGVRVGEFRLGISKDEVLRRLGKPDVIFLGEEKYTLNNLPRRYFMVFGDISFSIDGDVVTGITAHSPLYKFANGLRVGDSEQKIKQAFGDGFHFEEGRGKDFLIYRDKGLHFEIHKEDRTVMEIGVIQKISRGHESPSVKPIQSIKPFDDVRAKDLSKLDLSSRKGLIATLQFNQETVWPEQAKMPPGSNPQEILTNAMNPGLGVRELHQQGITGKGVNVAIIDQPLLKDHPEYDGKIAAYFDTGCGPSESSMHGPAVASLLVGTNCGTAPDARVYYAAAPSWKADAAYYAKGLDWIIAQNEKLPKTEKIRVVSVSAAPNQPSWANRQMWDRACDRAEADGIMVLDCTDSHRGFINRGWYNPEDPESVSKCNYGPPPKREFRVDPTETSLYVPSSCRTTAQHYDYHGRNSYIYWGRGGLSWAIPYCAGVLAMGWQIRPDLTPAQMKEMLFASAHVHESGAKIIHPAAFINLVRNQSNDQHIQKHPQRSSETLTIVPGVRAGEYTLGMSKDDVLRKLGEPEAIQLGEDQDEVVRRGEERYSLNDLPKEYMMSFGDISCGIEEDSAQAIFVRSPLYKLSNELKVGDSEKKIKQAFGGDFQPEEILGKDYLCYLEGVAFHIDKKKQTVAEIIVYPPVGVDSAEAALIRKAAAEGRILYKLTTPQEFKEIAGQPTREWTTHEGKTIHMEYPGVEAVLFGKSGRPHTVVQVQCGREIDIGQDRPIALRNEEDLKMLGSSWGCCAVDLSRLDLSQKGDLLERMPFDSLTVWPEPSRLPPGFEPSRRLEEGKNPGLGVRSLHQEGINGSGAGIAIIDQPSRRDHVEYADRIKSYHAIDVDGVDAQIHGPPVCSIAVGKTCGVAPGANLHYHAIPTWKWLESNRPWARTVEQIVQRNRDLPPSEKVRVISISFGGFSHIDHYDQWQAVVDKAKKNGILVVSCDDRDFMPDGTLERIVGKDPDDPNSYGLGRGLRDDNALLWVPVGNRSMASHLGKDVYTFDTEGGESWAPPYLAGLAALAFHVHPEISPDQIVELWQKTATPTKIGPVINPRGFIEAVKRL